METAISSPLHESQFYVEVKNLLLHARTKAYSAINKIMSQTYWEVGKLIVEQEQRGAHRAEYGSFLIKKLS